MPEVQQFTHASMPQGSAACAVPSISNVALCVQHCSASASSSTDTSAPAAPVSLTPPEVEAANAEGAAQNALPHHALRHTKTRHTCMTADGWRLHLVSHLHASVDLLDTAGRQAANPTGDPLEPAQSWMALGVDLLKTTGPVHASNLLLLAPYGPMYAFKL